MCLIIDTIFKNQKRIEDIDTWERQKGVKFLRRIGLCVDQTVLDFGCRVGHYTIPAAKIVGSEGIVYAVDKERQALNELEQKAAHLNLKNIRTINSSGQVQIDLESDSVDVVLFYDVLHYHEKKEREKLYAEAYRVLKQDGLLSVYPKHILEDNPIMEFQNLSLGEIKQEIQNSSFVFGERHCGLISHDDDLNQGCILNFRKSQGEK
ncbi:MAG: class I SAM-dependent methyltransferase [Planctomycetes bacterium]|nr:class I SAM-dependent methyltransferase [Planctomycetota bacterium]